MRALLALVLAAPLAVAAQNAPTFSSAQLNQMMAPIAKATTRFDPDPTWKALPPPQ